MAYASAQETLPQSWQEYIDYCDNDAIAEFDDWEELFLKYAGHPININDTSSHELRELFFLTPFQRASLKAYIEQYGALFSTNELYAVNGFDSTTVALMLPIVTTAPIDRRSGLDLKEMLRKGRHNILLGGNGTIEKAKGYSNGKYEGDRQRLYWRYQYKYRNNITIQLSGDKDPGEAFFTKSQKQGFDFYGFSAEVKDIGKIKKLLVGNYYLQFGQGATLWSGFAPYNTTGGFFYKEARGVTAASAFTEYGYQRGLAGTVEVIPSLTITLFYSNTPLCATINKKLQDSTIDGYPIVQSIYLSGYHRTDTEIAKKRQLTERLLGGNITLDRNNFAIGLTAYKTILDRYIVPAASRYNYYYFQGHDNFNIGLNAAYRIRNTLCYGETSLDGKWHNATLIGLETMPRNDTRLSLAAYNYDAFYRNLHANTQSIGGYTRNERGIMFSSQTKLPHYITAQTTIRMAHFPEMRSTAYGKSNAIDGRIRLRKDFLRLLSGTIQYRYYRQGKNVKRADNEWEIMPAQSHKIQIDLQTSLNNWHYTLQATRTWYLLDNTTECGQMIMGDIQYKPENKSLSVSFRLAYFDIEDYDARIYTTEHGIAYDNSSIAFNHKGIRTYLVVHYSISQRLLLGIKYSLTEYTDGTTIGSGNDALDVPHRQQWNLQLRIKL